MMNKYALKGHKVKFLPSDIWHGYDLLKKAEEYLTFGEIYTVESTDIRRHVTYVKIQEIPSDLNVKLLSFFFEDVEKQSDEDNKKHPDYEIWNIPDGNIII